MLLKTIKNYIKICYKVHGNDTENNSEDWDAFYEQSNFFFKKNPMFFWLFVMLLINRSIRYYFRKIRFIKNYWVNKMPYKVKVFIIIFTLLLYGLFWMCYVHWVGETIFQIIYKLMILFFDTYFFEFYHGLS